MRFFEGVKAMLNRTIYGIPEDFDTAGGQQFEYRPACEMGNEIHASDGGDWEPWRRDPDGQLWLRRVIRGIESAPTIVGFDADGDDDDELPDDDARSAFYRESAILRSIVARREDEDHDPEDFGDVDYGDDDDEL